MNKKKLFFIGLLQLFNGFILSAFCLFLSAGTIYYSKGWLFLSLTFGLPFVIGIILLVSNPKSIENRLLGKEKNHIQVIVMRIIGALGMICLILSGLSNRFQVLVCPNWCSLIGCILFIVALSLYVGVMIKNVYLNRSITTVKNQQVIDTGVYSLIRHPLYFALLLLGASIPLILGSLLGFIPVLILPFVLAIRIRNEEKYLLNNLDGYSEYTKKVKHRLIPFIW